MDWLLERLGGPARARVIATLAAVLALDSADTGAVGANAQVLEKALDISRGEVGLLLTSSSGITALTTLPFGWLADRTKRTRLLALAVLAWGVAMLVSGFATSYTFLLVTRLLLGCFIAAGLPAIASLTGDWFPSAERGQIFGYILSGEIVGAGIGLLIAGEIGTWWWRPAFWMLALPTPFLAWAIHRLPEPARDGSSRIQAGQEELSEPDASERSETAAPDDPSSARNDRPSAQNDQNKRGPVVGREAREHHVKSREHHVPQRDPSEESLWWAAKYVLTTHSYIVLIISSACAYYFFAGIRGFGAEFLHVRFEVPHWGSVLLVGTAATGALFGVSVGGRVADRLLGAGYLRARVWVTFACYAWSAVFFALALLVVQLWAAALLLFIASFGLGALNPPLDAARLDVMHPHLWGRAEAVRTTLRKAAEAAAPSLFGFIAGSLGLRDTFLLMLIPYALGALVMLIALRTYLPDAATAAVYAERTVGAERRRSG